MRLQNRKHLVSLPIESIVEENVDPERFVTKPWNDEVRTTSLTVLVKEKEVELMPALKIQSGTPLNQVVQAFDVLEQLFVDAVKNRRDPETSYLRILKLYTHRILKNEYFGELDPKDPRPKFK